MNPVILCVARPLLLGIAGLVLTFIAMEATPPFPTTVLCALLYLALGFAAGRLQPKSLWYAPLFMNLFLWVVFIPMGMEIWPPTIMIWYFLMPPVVALPAAYLGMYLGGRSIASKNTEQLVP